MDIKTSSKVVFLMTIVVATALVCGHILTSKNDKIVMSPVIMVCKEKKNGKYVLESYTLSDSQWEALKKGVLYGRRHQNCPQTFNGK